MKAQLQYTGIRVKDLDASIKFYSTVLGLTVSEPHRIAETQGFVADATSPAGGPPLELNYYEPGSPHATPFVPGEALDHLGFKVENLEAAIAEAERAGHPVVHEVKTAKSRWVYLQDPNGIWIELFG